ncbi:MAG: 5-carboxymethyl-2-hydroxymuconate semialdehyde dehydrogenase [Armatimonadota bacterium]|nr:5-carboxymethyl-2-hydroxymuconate semialdehyde dehydrogenase [Armatimonadota bacterium]MDR7567864.1 5-carboxymethyl-2-hydroxymuconate semialdehyde dehydrogenase [Armatimonadota bacterium]
MRRNRGETMQVRPVRHFIAGEFVEARSGRTFATLNPTTNEVITEVAEGDPADVDRAVQAARKAFHEGPWPRMRAEERARYLRRVGELILKHAEEIGFLEVLDTGMPISQAGGSQIPRAAENFFFFAEMASRILGATYPKDGEFLNYTIRRPVGVAGLITPWNTPFMLETWKVAPCLAAGCTCVLKPAEWSPLSAMKLAEIIQEADLPPGVFNVVHGYGEIAGAALVAHPQVPVLSFTGETSTGIEILRNAAPTLKRCSMELGGKNPTIVFADADLDRALDAAVFMGYSLNGERCTSGSRLLVERRIYDTFVDRFAARVQALRVGDPFDPATEVGPLIHPEHWQRVRGYVELARAESATVLAGGNRPENLPRGNYLQPTLIVDVRPEMRIAQEEIFGPVVVVMPFEGEEEMLRIANGVRYGLAAYLWTQDVHRVHRIAQALEAGMIWVNSHNVRDLRTPFGGMKHSGMGREGGGFSFELYCEYQTVHVALGGHAIPRMGVRA